MRRLKYLMTTSLNFVAIFGTLSAVIIVFSPLDCSQGEPENKALLPPDISPSQVKKMFLPDEPFPRHLDLREMRGAKKETSRISASGSSR